MKKKLLLFLLLLMCFSLSGCKRTVKSYDDMKEIIYRFIFAQNSNTYYVYFYRPYVSDANHCPACETVKDTIIDYANYNLHPIYLININNKKINEGMMLSCDDCENIALNAKVYTDIKIAYVPYLIFIQNGVVTKTFGGVSEIKAELTLNN